MNYSQKTDKIVVDTNILYMAWYNPNGKCAKIINFANKGTIELYAPDSVKIELIRAFKKRSRSDEEIKVFLDSVLINWIGKEIYSNFIGKTLVKHKPDKSVEAVALLLDCGILSADTDFKISGRKVDIDKLLSMLDGKVKC